MLTYDCSILISIIINSLTQVSIVYLFIVLYRKLYCLLCHYYLMVVLYYAYKSKLFDGLPIVGLNSKQLYDKNSWNIINLSENFRFFF